MRAVIYTDGAAAPTNPGPAGAGFVIDLFFDSGGACGQLHAAIPLGTKTNNEAEYEAVLRALKTAADFGVSSAVLRADSKLVVMQVSEEWQCRNVGLIPLLRAVLDQTARFPNGVMFEWVPREQNGRADKLSKLGAATSAKGQS